MNYRPSRTVFETAWMMMLDDFRPRCPKLRGYINIYIYIYIYIHISDYNYIIYDCVGYFQYIPSQSDGFRNSLSPCLEPLNNHVFLSLNPRKPGLCHLSSLTLGDGGPRALFRSEGSGNFQEHVVG